MTHVAVHTETLGGDAVRWLVPVDGNREVGVDRSQVNCLPTARTAGDALGNRHVPSPKSHLRQSRPASARPL
ncbi:hypothetical protein GCM10022255_107170 [Dactylosporangium darangshiense]|uniref:Uncharacterized protein n=1 Tax=Dactylosporangium darangshiense TaxID=579108 RepID=A0ABP8DTN7_9ACTN